MTRTIKFVFTVLLFIPVFRMEAQVKIGNNPTTINANSLLELESTSKGFLAPRVTLTNVDSASPLTAPVPAGMFVYNSGGSLTNGYYTWSGTKWLLTLTSKDARVNRVLVKSASDLPAPVGGIITLAATTVYEINGTIVLTSKLDLNGAWLKGEDAVNDKLVYPLTSGELFTGSKGGNIRNLTLAATGVGSKLFNIDAAGSANNMIIQNCYILGCDNIGTLKGYAGTVYMHTIAFFSNTNGITFQNDTNVLLSDMLWDGSNKNTYEKFTGVFSVIQQTAGDMVIKSSNSAVGIDVSGITSIVSGELKVVLFTGNGTYVNGTFSKQWEVECHGLNTEKDDVAAGNIYMSSTVTTTFTASNTPTKVLGTTTSATLFRVTSPSSNRLTYTGTKTRRFQVVCSLTAIQPSSSKYFSFYIAKNGVVMAESRQEIKIINSSDQGAVTLSCTVQLSTNDYIELWVENEAATTDLTVQTMNLAIK